MVRILTIARDKILLSSRANFGRRGGCNAPWVGSGPYPNCPAQRHVVVLAATMQFCLVFVSAGRNHAHRYALDPGKESDSTCSRAARHAWAD